MNMSCPTPDWLEAVNLRTIVNFPNTRAIRVELRLDRHPINTDS
jgi:hypothetical protein